MARAFLADASVVGIHHHPNKTEKQSAVFWIGKRAFDIVMSLLLLPVLAGVALLLLFLNPWLNEGPLLFVQKRMGRDCRPFRALKFRTMRAAPEISRSAEGGLEFERITKLGHVLRKYRLDELPQILNVLWGDMSLIGPRPDCYEHAEHYLGSVPRYRHRHAVRPGISGLAQVEVGYVEGSAATRRKVSADLYYIANANHRMEIWLVWRTIVTIVGRKGF
ncbi:sugar transferase [Psychromarinibacter sp. C21-152]|uniref:Sugar transferase n=1 Tax=Psychromarinibacter sediminicola TaxID=3033385 RepID=A0AAE3NNM1_9RHOB|nr:sugar transferase [Psychromarinibacter sediminicola]MDF0599276.1 sugar transferase [Psychromarinibacter sediminicola]